MAAPRGTGSQDPTALTQAAGEVPRRGARPQHRSETSRADLAPPRGQLRVQIAQQVFSDEAGLRSSKEINPQVRVRPSDGNQGETQSSDYQTGPR